MDKENPYNCKSSHFILKFWSSFLFADCDSHALFTTHDMFNIESPDGHLDEDGNGEGKSQADSGTALGTNAPEESAVRSEMQR